MEPQDTYLTISQFSKYYPWPTENGLRNRFRNRKTNGYEKAFLRDEGQIVVDVNELWRCLKRKNGIEE